MKKLIIVMMLVMLLLVPVSCTSTPAEEQEGEELAIEVEHWQIGENWEYGQQAIWDDIMVGIETVRQEGQTTRYIAVYNLHSREQERVLELPSDRIVYDAPAIQDDRVVWASLDRSEYEQQPSPKDSSALNWDVFLLDLKTGEVRHLTTDDRAQVHPRIYGDTIVWLDNRHEEGYHNPRRYDVYAYDLKNNVETRLTSTTSAEDRDLSIDGNLIVWTDNRHADPEVDIHAGNEPDYNNEIYVYDLTTNQERRVTTYSGNDHRPEVSVSNIVWLRQSDYRQADVFVYNVKSGQETQVSHSSYATYTPAIYKDGIVWTDARASKGNTTSDVVEIVVDIDTGREERREAGADIYLYDLITQKEVRLTSPSPSGWGEIFSLWVRPSMRGDFVVYMIERQIDSIVYAMRLTKK